MHIIQLYLLTESSTEALSWIPGLEQNTWSIPELHAAALRHEVTSPPAGPRSSWQVKHISKSLLNPNPSEMQEDFAIQLGWRPHGYRNTSVFF